MKIKDIQNQMDVDALIICRNNHFLGQDILASENKIAELTGFDGSAGKIVITKENTFLFVDGRYEIQSKLQTNPKEVTVIVENQNYNFRNWIKDNLKNKKIGYNPWQVSISTFKDWRKLVADADFIPLPEIIKTPRATVFEHKIEFSGMSSEEKIQKCIAQNSADAIFIGAADNVSWLTNLRSNALPETPIVRAFALLTANGEISLFADNLLLPANCSIPKYPLNKLEQVFKSLSGKKINADFKYTPNIVFDICKRYQINIVNSPDICTTEKAQKNPVEIQGIINAHIRDGVALCKFLYWLDKNKKELSETDIAKKLYSFRKKQKLFHSVSFATIAGAGINSAIVHYHPTKNNQSKIINDSVLLLDSGGQYFDGTTDVTRTIAIGTPTSDMKQKFTMVLKAHIALSSQKFPHNTSGIRLDAICRSILWNFGLDYNHGTGHGVGCFLNVHEGPQSMSVSSSSYPIKPNMVLSIEPGYYKENEFGIRIENLVYVAEDEKNNGFLKFIPLTLAPIDFRLIDEYLLNNGEKEWINQYHDTVYSVIAPLLSKAEQKWLERACSPL